MGIEKNRKLRVFFKASTDLYLVKQAVGLVVHSLSIEYYILSPLCLIAFLSH